MKRHVFSILSLLPAILLQGCSLFVAIDFNDFNDYLRWVHGEGFGANCDFETDAPEYILPSIDFIDRFEYKMAKYYNYQDPWINPNGIAFSYLYFEYSDAVYLEAKDFMLNEVKAFDDHYEYYGDFVFYENSKAVEGSRKYETLESEFPNLFWMLGYNDVTKSMLFCGFWNHLNEYSSWEALLEQTVLLTLDI